MRGASSMPTWLVSTLSETVLARFAEGIVPEVIASNLGLPFALARAAAFYNALIYAVFGGTSAELGRP